MFTARYGLKKIYICFVLILEQTAIISFYSINWLVFITETECAYCAVRTEYIYVLCGSQNKQRLFPYTALTDWFLELRRSVFTARYGLNIYVCIYVCVCVLCWSQNKHQLFTYTALTDWFLYLRRSVFTARYGLNIYIYMCVCVCVCVFCVDLRTNNNYFPLQH